MNFSEPLIRSALTSSNTSLVEVITKSLKERISKGERVSTENLHILVKDKVIARDLVAENLYKGLPIDKKTANNEATAVVLRSVIQYLEVFMI